jgi:hypothetical protein
MLLLVHLAYTITAMHANFVLCLFPPSNKYRSTRTCLQSFGACLRRFFRRFCFCLVLGVWSLSFTGTIPLLYSIDSNEKSPKPVYCPGTTQISYLEEWFDRNRRIQTILFNFIPFILSLVLSMIALLKLLADCLYYIYLRWQISTCLPCHKQQQRRQRRRTLPTGKTVLSTVDVETPIIDTTTQKQDTLDQSNNPSVQKCHTWCSTSFLRFLLVLSCCLLAGIYPIAMRFYLIYFSVLVPLIFTVMNYSSSLSTIGIPSTEQREQHNEPMASSVPIVDPSMETVNSNRRQVSLMPSSFEHERPISSIEQIELRSPLIVNVLPEHDECRSVSASSTNSSIKNQRSKPKYFANHLYENTRHIFRR